MSTIPPFVHTPLDAISNVASGIRTGFASHRSRPIEYRLLQLRKLYWALHDNKDAILEACKKDMGKPLFETYMSEVGWCMNDIVFVCNNLKKWAADESAPDIPFANKLLNPLIRKDPLGAVLIIGTYNFPIQLSIGPLIGAIAAGCTAVVKPSESAPNAAAMVQKLIEDALDPALYTCVQGAIPETTALLEEKWDLIFYTGGVTVAKIISKKAAETLTPVVLELGGKNPAIVTKNADIRLAARRLLWGKHFNAGQVCVSQNYIMVDESVLPTFIAELKTAMGQFYPNGAKASEDYARLVNARAFQRLKKMIDSSSGKILLGGTMDEKENFIEPTVVQVSSHDDSLLIDESFGPIIPILPVKDLDTAIRIANEVSKTPLGIYPFGTKRETDRILAEVRSGGATVNDAFFHASIPTLAFGGVGESGQGAYRGRASFEAFTHRRSIVSTPGWMERLLEVRYPPFTGTRKLERFQAMSELKPNFDREGREKIGIIRYILTLGGQSASKGLMRWLLVALVSAGWRQYSLGEHLVSALSRR